MRRRLRYRREKVVRVTAPSMTGRTSPKGERTRKTNQRIGARLPTPRPLSTSTNNMVKAAVLILSLVLSAILMTTAIGSADYPWIGWFALLPLLFSIRTLAPWSAMACGAVWGATIFVASALAAETPVPSTLQSFVLLTVVPALYAYVGACVTRRVGFSALAMGFGWIGVELALTPLGLAGGLLAGTQGHEDGSLLYFLQGLLGYGSVAIILAFINGIVLSLLSRVIDGSKSLYVRSSNGPQRRIFPLEVPSCLVHVSNPARPRAPPA